MHGAISPAYQQGYLLYLLGTTLIVQPFDQKRLEIAGEASSLAEQVQFFSVSQTGAVLAYWTGALGNLPQLTWFDRTGKRLGKLGDPIRQFNVRLSPDGTKLAAEIYERQASSTYFESDIWIYDVSRGVRSRLTSGPGSARVPCWSSDGKHIIFSSDRRGHYDLYEKAVDGGGNEELVLESDGTKYCQGWSPDNKFVIFLRVSNDSGNYDLWALPLFGDRKPFPYLQSEFAEFSGRFSPDGKWVLYMSDESGKQEIYVRPFGGSGGKLLVSAAGGTMPTWSHDGKEIFYLGPKSELMAARVNLNGAALEIDVPRVLFQTEAESFLPTFDVSPDGRRFIIVTSTPQKAPSPITVVLNWQSGLKKQ